MAKGNGQQHPAQRFAAAGGIEKGVALKGLMGRPLIALIGESLQRVAPQFDRRRFQSRAGKGLDRLELKQRARQIAEAMAEQLPGEFDRLAPLLIASLGPPLQATAGNGLAPFFYLPHSELIAAGGASHFEAGMAANYELTQRFTAEFSIRPLLVEHLPRCLKTLARWTRDPNPHVRRLVSEGTRPRLPWAMRLVEFQRDPHRTLPLLEALKDDGELYVRRSVANHLGDIAKDHLDLALDVCAAWLDEVADADDRQARAKHRRWLVRHALRHPANKGHRRATALRTAAQPRRA